MTMSWRGRAAAHFDLAVAFVLLTRLSLLLAAPVTLWLVATRRPPAEQGVFFILWNLQALTQLMELGVGTLMVQVASHESAFLDGMLAAGWPATPHRCARVSSCDTRWAALVRPRCIDVRCRWMRLGSIALIFPQAGEVGRPALLPWLHHGAVSRLRTCRSFHRCVQSRAAAAYFVCNGCELLQTWVSALSALDCDSWAGCPVGCCPRFRLRGCR